jgi:hypothetical protein
LALSREKTRMTGVMLICWSCCIQRSAPPKSGMTFVHCSTIFLSLLISSYGLRGKSGRRNYAVIGLPKTQFPKVSYFMQNKLELTDEVNEWVRKAEEDFRAANRLFRPRSSPTYNIVCFCAHQSANREETMKAIQAMKKVKKFVREKLGL